VPDVAAAASSDAVFDDLNVDAYGFFKANEAMAGDVLILRSLLLLLITIVSQLSSWGLKGGSRGVPDVIRSAPAPRGGVDEANGFGKVNDAMAVDVYVKAMF
jgi:hypothetical protein